ncbi:MAG: hypothetical protein ACKE5M_00660 [Methylophilaceae bacterium]
MSKLLVKSVLIFFSCITFTFAAQLPGNVALHIAKTHYLHPVHLLHPYLDVWHMKGPLAEKAAIASLQKRFAKVEECTENSEADVVLLLEPHMFYNPQMRVFHAEYIARAYTSNGEPITRIKKQARQNGSLGLAPNFYMDKSYTKAIDKVIDKLVVDQAFLAALDKNSQIKAGTICNSLDNLPLDKLYY